ncbi:MAG: hypothetical protein ABJF11_01060 [Reichenbachiella sp.]|uniref:hypothetical protein n=1 Tax=Reichenbachiella sp. TaxID=2184521 RepID=UPI0032652A10
MKDLNNRERENIRKTWKVLAPNIHEFAVTFYSNLHTMDPALVPTFDSDLDINKQADKALYSLGFIVASLDNFLVANEGIKKKLNSVFSDHKQIKKPDKDKVIKAFLMALKSTVRQTWNNEIAISWYRLLSLITLIAMEGKIEFEAQLI